MWTLVGKCICLLVVRSPKDVLLGCVRSKDRTCGLRQSFVGCSSQVVSALQYAKGRDQECGGKLIIVNGLMVISQLLCPCSQLYQYIVALIFQVIVMNSHHPYLA